MISISADMPIARMTFDTAAIPTFHYKNEVRALVGIDLAKPPGKYVFRVDFTNGEKLERTITVLAREKSEAPLGIPEKLGGNTTSSQTALVSTLAKENAVLAGLRTGAKTFWTEPFRLPLRTEIVITDPYGYSRKTGAYTIAHKGTDFRAAEGTRVRAMNRGVVRLAKTFRNYGMTIVVDHGLGVQTFYMHLSKINVVEGQLVIPGQILGLSGQTGYAESPHLHLTVRLNGTSVDPMKFLALWETAP